MVNALLLFSGVLLLLLSSPTKADWQQVPELTDRSFREETTAKTALLVTHSKLQAGKWGAVLPALYEEFDGGTARPIKVRRLDGSLYKAHSAAPHVTTYPQLLFLHGPFVSGKYDGACNVEDVTDWVRRLAALDATTAKREVDRLVKEAAERINAEEVLEARDDDARFAAIEALYASVTLLTDYNATAALKQPHAIVLFMTPSCDSCPAAARLFTQLAQLDSCSAYFVNVDQSKKVPGFENVVRLPATLYYRGGVPTAMLAECIETESACAREVANMMLLDTEQALLRQRLLREQLQLRMDTSKARREGKLTTQSTETGKVRVEL